ncbi:FAST kinase domain-containing protein 4 [Rhynchophorus ferrugineus]|uniref:FAST kinase domain-containing protein 4 n=1 Tax=Rhynchophorus ferrugineus TaxID=354439 RepID=UPI003FCE513B
MLKLYQKILKQHTKTPCKISALIRYNGFASSTAAEVKKSDTQTLAEVDKTVITKSSTSPKNRANLVKVAFASIQRDEGLTPATDEKIKKANTIDELLSISQGSGISRQHALKVVSVLSNWTSNRKIEIGDFESDPRFLRLCKILTKSSASKSIKNIQPVLNNNDLSTILNITADEEAAKIVSDLNISQILRVLSTLAARKRRSPLLLRAIAYNITASSEVLDIKQCADLLYSISVLNFNDENLFERVTNNIVNVLHKDEINKSAVIGSILTSIGLLKYKSQVLLDSLSDWIIENHKICRPQDIFSLFMTLAVVHYVPTNGEALFNVLLPQLTEEEAGQPHIWLEIVWSLVLLNKATAEQVKSVLDEQFLRKLGSSLSTSTKLKLLNIDGAAHYLIENYDGPKIPPDHETRKTNLILSNNKKEMVNSLLDTLKNLISQNNLKCRINTGLGFYIDAECILDNNCNPKPLTTKLNSDLTRVAVVAYDYYDMTKGKVQPTGVNVFSQNLLSAMGYKVVAIPYTDFNIRDKIVNKVKFLETQLRHAVKS